MADSSLTKTIAETIAGLGKMSEQVQRQTKRIMTKAAGPLIEEIQFRAPVSDEPHFRYAGSRTRDITRAAKGTGKVIATYMPGNLERSFGVLSLKKAKRAVYVGSLLDKSGSKGTFSGDRTDGYYAYWQEYGAPAAGIPPRPFIRPAVEAAKNEIVEVTKVEFTKTIEREAKRIYAATKKFSK